jgi:hypothetical protein
MSDLEAVNRMLSSIGQAPVNSLDLIGVSDASKAKQQLLETARDVQTVGWSWNTDYGVDLVPDATTGQIILPAGALDIDASDVTVNIVVRSNADGMLALYDADNQTFDFSANYSADHPLTIDIIWGYDFNSLPQSARSYIATAAARRFQAQIVNSPTLDSFNAQDEERAFLLLQRYERRSRDTNFSRKNPAWQRWNKNRAF